MSKAGKAAEPSMEEILSSIRKIIAEDPVAVRPAPGQVTADALDSGDDSVEEQPVVSTAAVGVPAAAKASLDDVLELADASPGAAAPTAADAGRNGAAIPSWLFPAPRVETVKVKAEEPVVAPAPKISEPAREAPKPFFPASPAPTAHPPRAAELSLQGPLSSSSATLGGMNGAHSNTPGEVKKADDLGSVVPRRSPDVAAPTTPGLLDRRSPQAGLPEWLSRASNGATKPIAPEPVAVPSEPTRFAPREPEAVSPALSELVRPVIAPQVKNRGELAGSNAEVSVGPF